jgi:hypothetical protein
MKLMKSALHKLLVSGLCWLGLVAPLPATALEAAKGKVILTLTGKVLIKNTAHAAVFDLAMLEKLPQQTFTTLTPWDSQPIKFTGPLLRDVLAAANARGTVLKAAALNDYQTSIPMEDAQKYDVIVAHRMNGEAIPVKTKGPLFIVYPYDSKTELRSIVFYERSAWQLKSIAIE